MVRGCLRFLRVVPGILLILGVFVSLTAVAPALAAPIQYPCPATESQVQADILDAGPGGTVQFACSSPATIPFTATITIDQSVTLDASRSTGTITFDGGGNTELFSVNSGVSFGLISLTLANGSVSGGYGGAVYNLGTVTVSDTTFSGNSSSAGGGAILNQGTVSVLDSTFYRNSSLDGGAIYNEGTAFVSANTFSGNSAPAGGAIFNFDTVTVSNSTFSDNSAFRGGAIFGSRGTVTIAGDIFAGSSPGGNCFKYNGTIADEGYNLDTDGSCTSNGSGSGDITGEDPMLAPLGNYGGPTQTMALLPGSPAIDQIPLGYSFMANATTYDLCPAAGTDQRGFARPDSNDGITETVCDIGAYEYQDTAYTIPGSHTAYDIESSNWYCTGGGITCIPPTDTVASDCLTLTPCPNASYGDVEAFGPPNNTAYGTPDELILACVHGTGTGYEIGYLDVVSQQGALDYPAGTRSYPGIYGTADSGAITGKGTLIGGGGSEGNPSQGSSVTGSAYDATTGIIGSVTGTQNTDNQEGANTLNSGGFTVTIRGRLWTVNTTGTGPVTTRSSTSSTISCAVGGLHANDLRTAGIDTDALAEGELENALGDNQFLPTFAPRPTIG